MAQRKNNIILHSEEFIAVAREGVTAHRKYGH